MNYRRKCPICFIEAEDEPNHKNSIYHRFNFKIFNYLNNRKALRQNRHGIEVQVLPEIPNKFPIKFENLPNKGKYITQVSPEQLQIHNNQITFRCKVINTRSSDDVYITNIEFLNPHNAFKILHPYDFTQEALLLKAGITFSFKILFQIDETGIFSFKIPFTTDCQTTKNEAFSILRTLVVLSSDEDFRKTGFKQSPFTSEYWEGIETYVPHHKQKASTDKFLIPKHLTRILKHGLTEFNSISAPERKELDRLEHVMGELNALNYTDYWHSLLWMEELEQTRMLTKYNMSNVKIRVCDDILVLEVPGLAEKRPSVINGDIIMIRVHNDNTCYYGLVRLNMDNETEIEIHFVSNELFRYIEQIPDVPLDVKFCLGRLSFERMHQAVEMVVKNRLVKYLFPTKDQYIAVKQNRLVYNLQDTEFYNKSIVENIEQKQAVIKILNFNQLMPYIIFGPPGTGKTITLVEAILQIRHKTNKSILISAPSNSACDNIALRLLPHCRNIEMIRMISENRDRSTMSAKLKSYSNIDETGEVFRVDYDSLKRYKIVISTLVLIGRYADNYSPDCVFIDEAGQASEPEADIAIGMIAIGKQVVLAGDPKQLGPMCSKMSMKFSMNISLMERLMSCDLYQMDPTTMRYNSNLITMLKDNFRSHHLILCIPNELYYDGQLEAKSRSAKIDPIVRLAIYPLIRGYKKQKHENGSAIEFYSVSSKEQREGNSPSFFNLFEVAMVKKYVNALLKLQIEPKVSMEDIGVVTPYQRQAYKIREMLRKSKHKHIEVGTTESFQGREKRIMIISTVRAQHTLLKRDVSFDLGFVNSDQRFNVAITRAMSKVIVIGCPLVLSTDSKWARFMELCRNHRTYFGDNVTPMRTNEFKERVLARMNAVSLQDGQFAHRQ